MQTELHMDRHRVLVFTTRGRNGGINHAGNGDTEIGGNPEQQSQAFFGKGARHGDDQVVSRAAGFAPQLFELPADQIRGREVFESPVR